MTAEEIQSAPSLLPTPLLFGLCLGLLSPSSCFLELISGVISWPQNALIAKSCSLSLQGYVLFRLGIPSVCGHLHVCLLKRRELAILGGSGIFKAGVLVILMDV